MEPPRPPSPPSGPPRGAGASRRKVAAPSPPAAAALPAGERDAPRRGGLDGRPAIGGDVDGVVAVVEVLADVAAGDGPAELAAAVVRRSLDGSRRSVGRRAARRPGRLRGRDA